MVDNGAKWYRSASNKLIRYINRNFAKNKTSIGGCGQIRKIKQSGGGGDGRGRRETQLTE